MANSGMRDVYTAMWLPILARGVVSLAFGILAFTYSGFTLKALVTVFGVYVTLDGLLAILAEYRSRGRGAAGLLQGLASLGIGVLCLVFPDAAAVYIILLIGLWNLAAGLFQITGAFVLRRAIGNASIIALGGLLSAALGLFIILYPADGALGIVWIMASTAILVGLLFIMFALSLRRADQALLR